MNKSRKLTKATVFWRCLFLHNNSVLKNTTQLTTEEAYRSLLTLTRNLSTQFPAEILRSENSSMMLREYSNQITVSSLA